MASNKQDLLDSLYPTDSGRSPANAENMALSNFARNNDVIGERIYLKGKSPGQIRDEYSSEFNKIALGSGGTTDELIKSVPIKTPQYVIKYESNIIDPVTKQPVIGYTDENAKVIHTTTPANLIHELGHVADGTQFKELDIEPYNGLGLRDALISGVGHHKSSPMIARTSLWNMIHGMPAYESGVEIVPPFTPSSNSPSSSATIYNRIQSGY